MIPAGFVAAPKGTSPTHVYVKLDDQDPFVVRTTNRDLIAWDRMKMRVKYGQASDSPFVFAAFLAWNAARREEQFAGTFDAFMDSADDLTSLVADDVAPEADAAPRPTLPTASSI